MFPISVARGLRPFPSAHFAWRAAAGRCSRLRRFIDGFNLLRVLEIRRHPQSLTQFLCGVDIVATAPITYAMNNAELLTAGRLPHMGIIRFTGPDVLSFLQGQVSNDTRRLERGTPLTAAYSTPQGRVLALGYLLPHSGGTWALLPRELISDTVARLRKFVLRAKVKIDDISDSHPVAGCLTATALSERELPVPGDAGYVEHDGIGIARVAQTVRFWVAGSAESLMKLKFDADAERAWKLADVRAGLPQVYAPTSEHAMVADDSNAALMELFITCLMEVILLARKYELVERITK